MLAGVTLSEAVVLIGHKHGTKTRELVRVLRSLGWECGGRMIPLRSKLYVTLDHALVKWSYSFTSGWHWVVVHDGRMYDPSPCPYAGCYGRPTSYLIVTPAKA